MLLQESDCSLRVWQTVPADWRRPDAEGRFDVYWSSEFDFGQVLPRPQPETVREFYQTDEYYTHSTMWDRSDDYDGLAWRALLHLAWRADFSVEPNADWWTDTLAGPPRKLLEIGSGNGTNLEILRNHGHAVEGIDPDPDAVRVTREAEFETHLGTAEDLPGKVSGRRFGCVAMMHVLEHCLEPDRAIRNAAGLLADDGLLVIEVPNNACLGAREFGAAWHWLDVPRHLNFFTERSLVQLVESHGLIVQKVEYRGYARQFIPFWIATQVRISLQFWPAERGRSEWWRYFTYFLRTAFAPARRKYDSVRIICSSK